ncbi:PEP-CTERM sorting domain-containing protein [Verrucomicrobia bacterium S94]|nr:PEP-CTERM sorting domain-containing protein [Verrucomicrobia bacterium S94]
MSKRMYFACGAVALALGVCADVSVITAVNPAEGWWSNGVNSSNKTMGASATITDAGGTYSGFTGISSVAGSIGGNILHGSIATDNPGTAAEALTDNRLDTGVGNPSDNTQFWLGETVSSRHLLAFIWTGTRTDNGSTSSWYDQPASITAFDSSGSQVGSTVSVPDVGGEHFGRVNLGGYTALNDRGIFGVTVDIADFGGTASEIAYVSIAGTPRTDTTDMMYVGTAAVPEPATLGLIALSGGAVLCIRRTFMI